MKLMIQQILHSFLNIKRVQQTYQTNILKILAIFKWYYYIENGVNVDNWTFKEL